MINLITLNQVLKFHGKKIIIITGKNICKKKIYFDIKKKIKRFFQIIEIKKINKNPTFEEVNKNFVKIKKFSPDLIISIGGGGVLDFAKILSTMTKPLVKKDLNEYYCKKKVLNIAVPFTAGTGAEVTDTAVIYKNGKKSSIEHPFIKPDYYILDPKLLLKCPKDVKAGAIFDAYSQSIESIFSKKSTNESEKYALKSLSYFKKSYLQYFNKPNLINAKNMQKAANLSGMAISISRTTAPHAASYPLSSLLNISHGFSVALIFNSIMKLNYKMNFKNKKIKNLFSKIFKILNLKNFSHFIKFNEKLIQNLDFQLSNKDKCKIKKNINFLSKNINYKRLNNNPINITKKDIIKVYLEI